MGASLLLFLLILSWFFFLERTTCFDSAWQSWEMIYVRTLHAEHHRFSTMLAQVVPVLLLKTGAPLGAVLRAYSVSFMLVHAVGFAFVLFVVRDRAAAMAIPLALVALVSGSFFFGTSEVQQGVSSPIIVLALFRRCLGADTRRAAWYWGFLALLGALWSSFYHMVFVLPVAYVLGHELLQQRCWRTLRFWILGAGVLGSFLVRSWLVGYSGYEQDRMVGAAEFVDLLKMLGDLASTRHMVQALGDFPSFWALVAVVLLVTFMERSWVLLLWTLGWSVACSSLILMADRDVGAPYMYENLYPIIGAAWAVHAAGLIEHMGDRRVIGHAGLLVALFCGGWQVWQGRYVSMDKVRYAERLSNNLRERGSRKAILSAHAIPWAYAQTHWTLPFETVLISALHGPDQATTVFAVNPLEEARVGMEKQDQFLGPDFNPFFFKVHRLDKRYFDLPSTPYVFATSPPDSTFAIGCGELSLELREQVISVRRDAYDLLETRLIASGRVPLRVERPHGVSLIECTVMRLHHRAPISRDLTTVEMDLPPGSSANMSVLVTRPKEAGTYMARVELLVDSLPTGVLDSVVLQVPRFPL